MSIRNQWAVVIAAVLLLGGALYAFEWVSSGSTSHVAIGAPAPAFSATTVDGARQVRRLADYRGHVTILNIWATWCEPCKAEMPALEHLYQALAPAGLKVAAVSVDETASDDSVATYARNLGLTFDVLHDTQYTIEQAYQVVGYPSSYLIDRDGRIRAIWLGAKDWTDPGVTALVRQLLGVSAEAAAGNSREPALPAARAATRAAAN